MSDDGVLGWESPGQGQQTGHLVLARCPAWDGFVQCGYCNLPRDYPGATLRERARLARWGVNEDGEHQCPECRRGRYGAGRGSWYTVHLRVFLPGDEGALPVRVVGRRVFADAAAAYSTKALQNAYLLGYAAELLDLAPQYPGASPAGQRAWAAGRVAAQVRRPAHLPRPALV